MIFPTKQEHSLMSALPLLISPLKSFHTQLLRIKCCDFSSNSLFIIINLLQCSIFGVSHFSYWKYNLQYIKNCCSRHYLKISLILASCNLFLVNVLILSSLKTQENQKFSGAFRGYEMGTLARNGLNMMLGLLNVLLSIIERLMKNALQILRIF